LHGGKCPLRTECLRFRNEEDIPAGELIFKDPPFEGKTCSKLRDKNPKPVQKEPITREKYLRSVAQQVIRGYDDDHPEDNPNKEEK
jgi:hypothetical protein